ncbi:hypothetical protein GGS20DRAFT_548535 [Poronia punctata]|nr:hypothetical protein GGS20DRAFT_548535 [Poronia punctata]
MHHLSPTTSTLLLLLFTTLGFTTAKTDLAGCVSSTTLIGSGASQIWYVPDTGEICDFLDCGGGRAAPPKTTVPGCPAYEGTGTYLPSFISGYSLTLTRSSSSSTSASASTTGMDVGGASVTGIVTGMDVSASASATGLPSITSVLPISTSTSTSTSTLIPTTSLDTSLSSSFTTTRRPTTTTTTTTTVPAKTSSSTGAAAAAAVPTVVMKGVVVAGLAAGAVVMLG